MTPAARFVRVTVLSLSDTVALARDLLQDIRDQARQLFFEQDDEGDQDNQKLYSRHETSHDIWLVTVYPVCFMDVCNIKIPLGSHRRVSEERLFRCNWHE